MELDNPNVFALFMLVSLLFVVAGFFVLFKIALPFFGRTIITHLKSSGHPQAVVMNSLRTALMPPGLRQALIRHTEAVYSEVKGAGY